MRLAFDLGYKPCLDEPVVPKGCVSFLKIDWSHSPSIISSVDLRKVCESGPNKASLANEGSPPSGSVSSAIAAMQKTAADPSCDEVARNVLPSASLEWFPECTSATSPRIDVALHDGVYVATFLGVVF